MEQTAAFSRNEISTKLREWPTQPGIYLMKDSSGRILYVGKAKNLRNRVRCYFQKETQLTPKTRILVRKIEWVEFVVTNTELEALLLECNLIKKHRPRYNIRLKDDKNYPYVVLDFTHPFPQIRTTRKVVISPSLKYFGPYSAGINEIGRFLLKTFQIRDCSDAKFKNRTRPCLNYEIGTCTAPCVAYVSQEDYARQLREAMLFLRGKRHELLDLFKKEMKEASLAQQYERAKTIRDKIRSIEKMSQRQDSILPDQQKDIDVVGFFVSGDTVQWVVLFIRGGFLIGRRTETTPLLLDSIDSTLQSFLEQFYAESLIPDELWVATDFPGRLTLEKFLSTRRDRPVKVRVGRSEKLIRLLGMAQENAKLIFNQKGNTPQTASKALKELLSLAEEPHAIEGVDVSNLQGKNPAIAWVHFADERPLKSRYRLFYPRKVTGQNDFAMIHEATVRRFSNKENPPPDLLLIDGGKGQLSAAVRALEEVGVSVPVLALAKERTERAFTRKEVKAKVEERIFIPNRKNPILPKDADLGFKLLQRVRDEAHRFSVKSHRVRRRNEAFKDSALTKVKGIGEKTRQKLLRHFGSLSAIGEAPDEMLRKCGLSAEQVAQLRSVLKVDSGAEE